MKRWLGVTGAAFVVAVTLAFSQEGAAVALAPPVVPIAGAGEVTTGGEAVGGVCAAAGAPSAGTGCVLVAGVGAFVGTCYVLGKLFHGSCGGIDGALNTPKTIVQLLFGAYPDQRVTYTGPPNVVGVTQDTSPMSLVHTEQVRVFAAGNAGNYTLRIFYNNGLRISAPVFMNSTVVTLNLTGTVANDVNIIATAFGVSSGTISTSCPGGSCSAPINHIGEVLMLDSAFTTVADWHGDLPSSWTVTYNEVCELNGEQRTFGYNSSFTPPDGGGTSPAVEMSPCNDLWPGSHLADLNVDGGRANITSPDPKGVHTHVGTYPSGDASSYPLCTTNAPAGGCWLDLQKAGKSCFAGAYCAGWVANEDRWNMECDWGPYEVPIARCVAEYGTRFDTQVQPDPGGDPTPTTPTDPNEHPCYAGCTNPEIPPDPSPTDPQTSCISAAFSWNPIDWVYVPVKCALKWAFVPPDAPSFTDIADPLPVGWIPSFPSLSGGACGPIVMPSISLGPLLEHTGSRTMVNTCDDPWPLARDASYYGILAVGLVRAGNRGFRIVLAGLGMAVDYAGGGDDV